MAEHYPHITTLIPDLREGDRHTWDRLVALFQPALLAKATVLLKGSRLQRHLSAEDLVGVTMAKAWKNHATMMGQSTYQVAKWLLTIMLNTYRDACRKNRLPEEWQDSWVAPPDLATDPANRVEAAEEEIRLHAKIAELEPEDREVILLRFWHNLTHQ
ncbi:MAG: sigma-70 family RNA polymerase sigma factor, partial [Planctomycetota bacterium]